MRDLPIVVFTGKDLSADEEAQLKKAAKSVIIKGVESPERLLDETALFLHRVIADLPREAAHGAEPARLRPGADRQAGAGGRRRRAQHLRAVERARRHGMDVVTAGNGQEAVLQVEKDEEIALVLMDIMMPEMDGYQTMKAIRSRPTSARCR
jgi:CheY-like chemotaxis protein